MVTGASRGIGRAVALAAAERGASVGLIARTSAELDDVLAAAGGKGAVATADVGDRAHVEAAVARLEAELGPPDIVVANAGIGAFGPFAESDLGEVERLIRVNLMGTVYLLRTVVPGMIQRRRGHIVTIGSIAGRIGVPLEAVYSASKFGQVGLSEALAFELEPFGIGVSMINPGPVATGFADARGHAYDRSFPKAVPVEDVTRAVMDAVEGDTLERFVPRWLAGAVFARHVAPPLHRWGTRRSFR